MTKLTLLYLSLFLATTIIGSILLYLPITGRKPISIIDAFFVATSAFTVTGLSTVDVPKQFNDLGYFVIMSLIQIGGLGIVTLTIFILILSKKRISFKNRELLMISWNNDDDSGLLNIAMKIVLFSLTVEFVGFLFLNFVFMHDYGLWKGGYISLFTSISAFNNAGFSLFSDNMMSYSHNFIINIVVPLLIIIGGVGYIVFLDLWKTNRFIKLSLHSKIVISTTTILILVGTILFWLLEFNNTLKGQVWHDKLMTSFFQSVTTRTAGFNSVDIGAINDSTILLFIVLMFIGAAPMSTGGGIKVTTFTLVVVYLFSQIKGIKHPHLFKKSLDLEQMYKAILVFIISIMLIIATTFILLILNPRIGLNKIIFEVVSAFGTVGVSTGITADLTDISKVVIMLLMIIGKIGILIILSIFTTSKQDSYYYVKEKVQL
ncbi:TrkH family potassium uptake protein [Mammaliicoccus stepanovicii]|nr:TrkH family potassium uptake protein [Mammaliicoccus stepanovicii]